MNVVIEASLQQLAQTDGSEHIDIKWRWRIAIIIISLLVFTYNSIWRFSLRRSVPDSLAGAAQNSHTFRARRSRTARLPDPAPTSDGAGKAPDTMASLIPLVLQASIILTVFAIGLSNRARDVLQIARTPGLLLRSLVSINILMPLFAALMAAAFALMPAVEIALIALAVSPIPPLLPKKAIKAGGDASFAIGLLAAAALLAIAFVPVSVHVLGIAFGKPAEIPPGQIAKLNA
jgi:hypothetical protein